MQRTLWTFCERKELGQYAATVEGRLEASKRGPDERVERGVCVPDDWNRCNACERHNYNTYIKAACYMCEADRR